MLFKAVSGTRHKEPPWLCITSHKRGTRPLCGGQRRCNLVVCFKLRTAYHSLQKKLCNLMRHSFSPISYERSWSVTYYRATCARVICTAFLSVEVHIIHKECGSKTHDMHSPTQQYTGDSKENAAFVDTTHGTNALFSVCLLVSTSGGLCGGVLRYSGRKSKLTSSHYVQ